MFSNYLKVAVRHITRHKFYSFINIFGLAVGMACVLFIVLWVQDEFSFDRYHKKADRIHRIIFQYEYQGEDRLSATTPWPLKPALLNDFPEIEHIAKVERSSYYIRHQNNRFFETVFIADPEIFDIFTIPLLRGESETALTEPYSLLLSESKSRKYFSEEDPLGQTLQFENGRAYKITGVFKDIPSNSHLRFDFLISFHSGWEQRYGDQWGMSNFWQYCLIPEDFDFTGFESRMGQFVEKYSGREAWYEFKTRYWLQPVPSIHLFSHLRNEVGTNGSLTTITLFSAVGLFILLIACFNTINLSTARFTIRTREVGLRKVLGADRKKIIKQFMGETLLLSFLAMLVANGLMCLFLPLFNSLSGKALEIAHLDNGLFLLGLSAVTLLVGLGAGSYPALFLSSFQPVNVLKGSNSPGLRGALLRKILIVAQFAIGIIFIAGTLIIQSQLRFIQNRDLGLQKEQIVNIPLFDDDARVGLSTIKTELERNPNVLNSTASNFFPGNIIYFQSIRYEGMADDSNPMMHWLSVDYDFIESFGLEILQGRNFDRRFPTDLYQGYILNEAAVREIGWESSLGKRLQVDKEGSVIGVIKDFHFKSLHREIEPLILAVYPELYQTLAVKMNLTKVAETLAIIQDTMKIHAPNQVFSYKFLDEEFNNLYKTETRLSSIISYVAFLSVLIACLGLLGLSALTAEFRTKEIGIRKVLGAPVSRIFVLLSGEYLILLVVSNLLALPVAYYVMYGWLQNFAYRTRLGVELFVLAAGITFVISLLTVGFQSVKAARANPVDSLRYE
ncbi:ABC transporter permease [Acidobacteriota bacterium]